MKRHKILIPLILTIIHTYAAAQVPSNIDPGNPGGEQGTAYFWDQPEVYIPALIAVVVLMVIFWIGRKRKK